MGRIRLDVYGCAGQHCTPAVAEPDHLVWYRVPRPDRVRVLANTCGRCPGAECALCSSGGRYLIRRNMSGKTYETPRVQRLVAWAWWAAILDGRAV